MRINIMINNGAIIIMIIMLFVANLCLVGKTMGAAYYCSNVTLASARDNLVRQEDTIIFSLIERAKFPFNAPLYAVDDKSLSFSSSGSLFQYFVNQSEALQSQMGRYLSKEELPFFHTSQLPRPLTPIGKCVSQLYPKAADVNASTNVNSMIWNLYLTEVLHNFTKAGNDENYASTATADLLCLQALSRRIHYGRFVAEAKYSSAPHQYNKLIHAKNKEALMNLLTNKTVEDQVVNRVGLKAKVFAKEVTLNNTTTSGEYNIDPIQVSNLYENLVIPLTRNVEVEYLLRRLDPIN